MTAQSPRYWLDVLIDALRAGDFDTARHADHRLREIGFDIVLRRILPREEAQSELARSGRTSTSSANSAVEDTSEQAQ